MTRENFRAATVGCGRMGAFHNVDVEKYAPVFWMPQSHLHSLEKCSDVETVACCDSNPDALEKAQTQYRIENGYADFSSMLKSEKCDLLTIATRTTHKAQIVLSAIDQGLKAIHVEKPLCNTVRQLDIIESKTAESNVLLTYGCLRRYMPCYNEIRELAHSETHEGVRDVHVEMGKSMLLWVHTHSIDLILFFLPNTRPVRVQGWFEKIEWSGDRKNVVHNDPILISATIEFENGAIGRIGQSIGHAVTISTVKGRLEVLSNGREFYECLSSSENPYLTRSRLDIASEDGSPGGSSLPIGLLLDGLRGSTEACCKVTESMDSMFNTQRIIFALLASHQRNGAIVELEDIGDGICGIEGIHNGAAA